MVKNLVRQVSSSRMGMFRRKGLSGPHESYDVVGYLMGGFKGKLKGSKSLRKFANIRCIEAKEVKRTKQKGLDF